VVKAITSTQFIPLIKLTNMLVIEAFLLLLRLVNILPQGVEKQKMASLSRLCLRAKTLDMVMFVTLAGAIAATVHGPASANALKH